MKEVDPESMARLANRLAMLTTDSGEAENAGRAVGALARKLGLTGGDLKQIFLDGLRHGPAAKSKPPQGEEGSRARIENRVLRHRLDELDMRLGEAMHERDMLRAEVTSLRMALSRKRATAQGALIFTLTALAAVFIGALLFYMQEDSRGTTAQRDDLLAASQGVFSRFAKVRSTGARIRDIPDTNSPVMATIPSGARLSVRRLLWNGLQQWAEVDVDGRNVYVQTTDVDLP